MASYLKDAFRMLRFPAKYKDIEKQMWVVVPTMIIGVVVFGQQAKYHHDHHYSQYKGKSQLYRNRMKKLPANIDPWSEKPYLRQ